MKGIFSPEASCDKQQIRQRLKWIRNAEVRKRYLIVVHLLEDQAGRPNSDVDFSDVEGQQEYSLSDTTAI